MDRFGVYFGRFQGFRGDFGGLPGWAQFILLVAALPGLVLMALSALVFLVSLFVLLFLILPTYRLLMAITGGNGRSGIKSAGAMSPMNDVFGAGRRHVQATVIDSAEPTPRRETQNEPKDGEDDNRPTAE